jgi:hypothetical protein
MKSSNTKLKKYASVLNDAAPKGEFLAYINKDEAKLLRDNGGLGLLTDFGVPSYRFAGGYQGGSPGNTGGSKSSSGGGGSSSGGGGGRDSGGGGGGNDNAARAREQAAERSRQEAAAKAARDREAAIAQEAANREAVREAAAKEAADKKNFVNYLENFDNPNYSYTPSGLPSAPPSILNGGFEAVGKPYVEVSTKPVAPPSISQAPIEVGIPDSESGFVDVIGTIPAAPDIFDINVLGDPALRDAISENLTDPGFVRALDELATRQADPVFGDPDPYIDVPIEDRDTITSFLDNYRANVASNPFAFGLLGALKTAYQTSQAREMMRGTPGYEFLGSGLRDDTAPTSGGDRDTGTTTAQPTVTTPATTLPQSMVNQYFANLGSMGQPLSSSLQTDYNNAKNSINSILGITPPSQQFGYSADPYGGLMASNLTTNPFNIDYLRRLGLI